MAFSCHNKPLLFMLVVLLMSMFISLSTSYDPKSPPASIKEVCNRCGAQTYDYCIAVFNTGSSVDGINMRFLSYYTRDFAENNVTKALIRINTTLIPNQPDPYIQEVLRVCKDSFSRLKDELDNRVRKMIVERGTFEEAKVLVNYGIGLMNSCREVCNAKPNVVCLLDKNIRDTNGVLRLLAIVLQLLTEGVM